MKKKILSLVTLAAVVLLMMPQIKAEAASVTYPKVVIDSVTTDEAKIYPGDEVTLHVSMTNMSTKSNVSEVLVTYTAANDAIVPVDGQSNQTFIDEIKAGETVSSDITVKVMDVKDSIAKITFNLQYVVATFDDQGRPVYTQQSNSAYIVLNIASEERFLSISNLSVPSDGALYEKGMISFNYANTGSEDIADLKVIVAGLNDGEPEVFSVGDVKSKKTGYFENYVTYVAKGNRTVSIAFAYTNDEGEEVTSEATQFTITVYEKASSAEDGSTTVEPVEVVTTGFNMSYVFVGIAGLLVLICVIFALVNARKNK